MIIVIIGRRSRGKLFGSNLESRIWAKPQNTQIEYDYDYEYEYVYENESENENVYRKI